MLRRLFALTIFLLGIVWLLKPASAGVIQLPRQTKPTSTLTTTVRFAIIGDYGVPGQAEADVAQLVQSWSPEFIITLGDNNYPAGVTTAIDQNIGQYYHSFIGNYAGSYGPGATENRFFPSLGNHDWQTESAGPYLAYFTLPGNERYYSFTWGEVQFFVVNSNGGEPDGIEATSAQGQWLQSQLAASTASWRVVYFHHPPYSSGAHGSQPAMQWPFAAWGADVVLAGHDHDYERIMQDNMPYIVNGLSGTPNTYPFGLPVAGSLVRFNEDYGAMQVDAGPEQMRFRFITRAGVVVDDFTLFKPRFWLYFPVIGSSG